MEFRRGEGGLMAEWDDIYREQGVFMKKPMEFIVQNVNTLREYNVKKVLDLGCGTGRHLIHLIEEGFDVVGVDNSPKAIELVSKTLEDTGIRNVELKVADYTKIPWPDESFDAVLCINVIQHGQYSDIQKGVSEIRRILRSGGILLLVTLSTKDVEYGKGKKIEENTFITELLPDSGVLHHFFSEEELKGLFNGLEFIKLNELKRKPQHRPTETITQWQLVGRKK
jgi:ubiquinone/menaquinone biosynthesis C-methylase UbiE